MQKLKHTPLPWGYDGDGFDSVSAQLCDTDGYTIFPLDEDGTACGHIAEMSEVEGDDEAEANAAFIVLAVNSHYAMREALLYSLSAMESVLCDPDNNPCFEGSNADRDVIRKAMRQIQAAIAKAAGAAS